MYVYISCVNVSFESLEKEEVVSVVSYLSSGENGMQLRSHLQRMSMMAGLAKGNTMGRQAKLFCVLQRGGHISDERLSE